MSAIDIAVDMLKRHEGYRRFPYLDTVGVLTVGYGRNLRDVGISETEAEQLLANDAGRALVELSREPYFAGLSETRLAVLVDMAVNLGMPRFRGFQRLRSALLAGDYERAAVEMLDSTWADQVGARALELAEMMRRPRVLSGAVGE